MNHITNQARRTPRAAPLLEALCFTGYRVMRLIGSKMESDFREELVRSNEALQDTDSKLGKALAIGGHDTKNAYVLHWVHGQLEDL